MTTKEPFCHKMVISLGPDLPLGTSTPPAEDQGKSAVHT